MTYLIVVIEGQHGGVELETISVHHIVLEVSVPGGERLVEGVGPHVVVEVVASPCRVGLGAGSHPHVLVEVLAAGHGVRLEA